MSKTKDSKQFFTQNGVDIDNTNTNNEEFEHVKHILRNKYYNIFRSNFKTEGLTYREAYYVMNKFWRDGTVAAFNIPIANELGYASWCKVSWDMYGEPETAMLNNEFGSPFVPTSIQVVDKDIVIGYIQSNRKPIKLIVDWYIDRIAQCEMVINTNLQLQKMPYIIPISDKEERKKLNDVVNRILNNELVICVDGVEPATFKSIATNVPYVIDKLCNYKHDLEDALLTYLGVNNSGTNKVEQAQMAEINSNDEEINLSDDDFNNNLEDFCQRVSEVLGKQIHIYVCGVDAQGDGQAHDNNQKTGPKDDGMED